MKLAGGAAAGFCRRPDPQMLGALLHGPDAGLLALKRRELAAALTEGDDLRLARVEADALRKDPAALDEALRARGFFPGRRAVVLERAKDGLTATIKAALEAVTAEDAFLIVTAEGLTARSSLRGLFEADRRLAALGLYPDPPDAVELGRMLSERGAGPGLSPEAMEMLAGVALETDPGTLSQLVEKIAVYALDAERPISAEALAPLLPQSREAALDALVDAAAEGRTGEVGRLLARVSAAGVSPVAVVMAVGRHIRALHAIGVPGSVPRMPPMRLRALQGQRRGWTDQRLEQAIRMIAEIDRTLRSPGTRPDRAIAERCLLRLSVMSGGK